MAKAAKSVEKEVMEVLETSLRSIWESDAETYRKTAADDCSFFEWYISPQRIDGLEFHIRELRVHRAVVGGGADPLEEEEQLFEHEILQPRVQVYGECAIVTFTLMVRAVFPGKIVHKSHNETRVFYNFGTKKKPDWKLVHCHKSPITTPESLSVLRT
jgi:ketosteroid isomerase-like protein